MKKILSILLILLLGVSLVSTGAFAKGKPDSAGNGAGSSQNQAVESNTESAAQENQSEEEDNAQTAEEQAVENQAKNKGQEKKLAEGIGQNQSEEEDNAQTIENQARNNGQEKKLEERIKVRGMNMKFDVPPVIKEGRTLIPVRAVMNGLGAGVEWDQESGTVTIVRDDTIITLNLLTGEATVNGEAIELDVPAQMISSRTFVPLRFIAQTLGEEVNYDETTGDISIGDSTDEQTSSD